MPTSVPKAQFSSKSVEILLKIAKFHQKIIKIGNFHPRGGGCDFGGKLFFVRHTGAETPLEPIPKV